MGSRHRSVDGDIEAAIDDAGRHLHATYSAPFWPRGNEADASERHLSFAVASGLRARGYTVYFEVPFSKGGYLDLLAVNWERGWQVAAEFKNLYRGGKQASSLARDVRRLRKWPGLVAHRPTAVKRLVLGSTWHPKVRADWVELDASTRFKPVQKAFGSTRPEGRVLSAAKTPGSRFPQQWLLWAAF